jgi:hypothetical protein
VTYLKKYRQVNYEEKKQASDLSEKVQVSDLSEKVQASDLSEKVQPRVFVFLTDKSRRKQKNTCYFDYLEKVIV